MKREFFQRLRRVQERAERGKTAASRLGYRQHRTYVAENPTRQVLSISRDEAMSYMACPGGHEQFVRPRRHAQLVNPEALKTRDGAVTPYDATGPDNVALTRFELEEEAWVVVDRHGSWAGDSPYWNLLEDVTVATSGKPLTRECADRVPYRGLSQQRRMIIALRVGYSTPEEPPYIARADVLVGGRPPRENTTNDSPSIASAAPCSE